MSKRQVILDWMVSAAGPLRAISTTAGFNNTVAVIQRGQRSLNDMTDADFPCLFIADTDERRDNITINQFNAQLRMTLYGAVKSENGVSGAQALLDQFIEDVTKAIETDRLQGHRVNTTWIERIETDQGDLDPHAIFAMVVLFKYTSEGINP